MQAAFDQSLSTGWQVEFFRREGKSMKTLDHYLRPRSDEERADEGASKVLALFQHKAAKGRIDGDQ